MVEATLGYSIRRFDSVSEMAHLSGSRAALVAVSERATCDIAELLAREKFAQYIEKPMATDVVAAIKLLDAISISGQATVLGENFRYQERFARIRSAFANSGHPKVTHISSLDRLRRGARDTPRSDLELLREQIVHVSSVIRLLLGEEIALVESAVEYYRGTAREFQVTASSASGIPIDMRLEFVNTWSEDRYALTMGAGSSIEIKHDYNHRTAKYTDRIETWTSEDDAIRFEDIVDAPSGMEALWSHFVESINTKSGPDIFGLREAVRDVQFREAVTIALETTRAVRIPTLFAYPDPR